MYRLLWICIYISINTRINIHIVVGCGSMFYMHTVLMSLCHGSFYRRYHLPIFMYLCTHMFMFTGILRVHVGKHSILLTCKQVSKLHSSKCGTKWAKWIHLHQTRHNAVTCQKHYSLWWKIIQTQNKWACDMAIYWYIHLKYMPH
jgi:hypothetical protein